MSTDPWHTYTSPLATPSWTSRTTHMIPSNTYIQNIIIHTASVILTCHHRHIHVSPRHARSSAPVEWSHLDCTYTKYTQTLILRSSYTHTYIIVCGKYERQRVCPCIPTPTMLYYLKSPLRGNTPLSTPSSHHHDTIKSWYQDMPFRTHIHDVLDVSHHVLDTPPCILLMLPHAVVGWWVSSAPVEWSHLDCTYTKYTQTLILRSSYTHTYIIVCGKYECQRVRRCFFAHHPTWLIGGELGRRYQ